MWLENQTMDKIRKIKGGMSMFVTEDETLLVNSNC